MTKLEQVARAIWAKFEENPDYARLQMNAILAEELARAAVEAMQEPTEAMQKAGFLANRFDNKSPCEKPTCIARITMPADAAWSAMIDSILNEREG